MKIQDNLYWYPYKTHGFSSNIYAIDQGDEIWLFDVGISKFKFFSRFLTGFKTDGLDATKISKIFITHGHPDHITGITKILKIFAHIPEIYIHPLDLNLISHGSEKFWENQVVAAKGLSKELLPLPLKWMKKLLGFQMGLLPTNINYQSFKEVSTKGKLDSFKGEKYSLQVYHTPGHSPGHCSYYIPELQFLIAGDIFGRISNKPVINLPSANFSSYLDSLHILESLKVIQWGTGHGPKIFSDNSQYLDLCQKTTQNLLDAEKSIQNTIKGNQSLTNSIDILAENLNHVIWNGMERKVVTFSILQHLDNKYE
jgi:glyoxylase-like metal-dependent hydrolase (beta-lactamase superfamily II)